MTMERPFSPLIAVENRSSALRRAQSAREESVGVDKELVGGETARQRELPVMEKNVIRERVETPVQGCVAPGSESNLKAVEGEVAKTPKKSKSKRFLRLLGH